MSLFGPGITQSIAGAEAAQRAALREQARKARAAAPSRRSVEDELDLEVSTAESADAVRGLKGNEQEEASLDHKGHQPPTYQPPAQKPDEPSLDVQG